MNKRKRVTALFAVPALLAALVLPSGSALADQNGSRDVDVRVTIPQAEAFEVTDAQLRWGVNTEVTSGSFFGGCNFLTAGVAGDAGSSRVWGAGDGLYKATEGNTRIEKPGADGKWVVDSWDSKCQDGSGRQVGTAFNETGTGAQAVMEQGQGTVDPSEGTARIAWKGSFTIVMYGGMTYWSISDPVLTVANGKGRITATASGYAADREDTTQWRKLTSTQITMADLPKAALGAKGIASTPAYRGVQINAVQPEQVRTESWWGSFPKDWIEFNQQTGQAAYWYSSGGSRDSAKVASDLYISYTAKNPVLEKPTSPQAPVADEGQETVVDGSQDSGGGTPAPGQDGAAAPLQSPGLQPLGSALPPISALTGSGTSVLEAAALRASAINWLGKSLIPEAVELAKDYRQALLWSLAGLLALATVAWVGFRRGWLVWPFSSKREDQSGES